MNSQPKIKQSPVGTYPLDKAAKCAEYIIQQLEPHCKRIHLAGSIRRRRYQVKDIEIVCEPKKEFKQTDLFGGGEWHISRDFTETIASIASSVLKGNVAGKYMQIVTNSKKCPGIVLDLFMPSPDDYYRMLAIRTGSAEYVHEIIAAAWLRKGWCGVKDLGLRRIEHCICYTDKAGRKTWKLIADITELPPAWDSEKEFFDWLGLPVIDSSQREVRRVLNSYL